MVEKKPGRYENVIRPFITLTEKEDACIEKFLADLRIKKGTKILKSDFIAQAAIYCARQGIDPTATKDEDRI